MGPTQTSKPARTCGHTKPASTHPKIHVPPGQAVLCMNPVNPECIHCPYPLQQTKTETRSNSLLAYVVSSATMHHDNRAFVLILGQLTGISVLIKLTGVGSAVRGSPVGRGRCSSCTGGRCRLWGGAAAQLPHHLERGWRLLCSQRRDG